MHILYGEIFEIILIIDFFQVYLFGKHTKSISKIKKLNIFFLKYLHNANKV